MKIIQIGFNKCGTTSIDTFLLKAGFRSIHWDHGKLAKTLKINIELGLPPLAGYENYQCFSDLELVGNQQYLYAFMDYFVQIDKHYDDALFILNVRPIDKWLASRIQHNNGSYLKRFIDLTNSNEDAVISYWTYLWKKHIQNATAYFKGRDNFLIFDIEQDGGEKLCQFLKIDGKYSDGYTHMHRTELV
ncbi:MAG: sulfotransferase [Paraglaciecola sp.]|uniref:sulfotransferase n=1 Tax=Paraglaciecola sp. TaxID=1920173 RepID=UPI003265D8AA